MNESSRLDATDQRILTLLQGDARMSNVPNPFARPVWHWYALAAVLLVVLGVLDLAGAFHALGPARP